MLTLAKIKTYERFGGDGDGYSLVGRRKDSSGITDDDWALIGRLCQALYLIDSGWASSSFRAEVEQEFQAVTEDYQTREAMRKMANAKRGN